MLKGGYIYLLQKLMFIFKIKPNRPSRLPSIPFPHPKGNQEQGKGKKDRQRRRWRDEITWNEQHGPELKKQKENPWH